MVGTDDLTTLFDPVPGGGLAVQFHQGTILTWDNQTGQNTVHIKGAAVLSNLGMLNSTEAWSMRPGMVVAVLSAGTQFFILGRIAVAGSDQVFTATLPGIGPAFYPKIPDAALQTSTVGGFFPKLACALVIHNRKIVVGGNVQVSGAAATGDARVQWYSTNPPNTADPPGGTLITSVAGIGATTGTPGTQFGPVDYTWPAGMRDQVVYLSYEARLAAGTGGVDWCSVVPTQCYGKD